MDNIPNQHYGVPIGEFYVIYLFLEGIPNNAPTVFSIEVDLPVDHMGMSQNVRPGGPQI